MWLSQALSGNDPEMRVSHETIYMSLFVQGRGACGATPRGARSGRATRRAKTELPVGRGKIPGMVMISERPAEVADRAVPGHWEGETRSWATQNLDRHTRGEDHTLRDAPRSNATAPTRSVRQWRRRS